ncbi:MAG: helix-turn-helix domain-containing protein [Christensenella sp.]
MKTKNNAYEKKTYTVMEIAQLLGISQNAAYDLVKENCFKSVRIGTAIRISRKSFDEWLNEKL